MDTLSDQPKGPSAYWPAFEAVVQRLRADDRFKDVHLETICFGGRIDVGFGWVDCFNYCGRCMLLNGDKGKPEDVAFVQQCIGALDVKFAPPIRFVASETIPLPVVEADEGRIIANGSRHRDLALVQFGAPEKSRMATTDYTIDGRRFLGYGGLMLGAMIETVRDYVEDANMHLAPGGRDVLLTCRDATIQWPHTGGPGVVKGNDNMFMFLSGCWDHARERVVASEYRRPTEARLVRATRP